MTKDPLCDNINDFNDPTLTIDDWIEQFKIFKQKYGGHTFITTDAGYNNVNFEIWVDPDLLKKAMEEKRKFDKYMETLPKDVKDIVTGIRKI